jgi:TetR/AcrR family transcriptional regulator, mexJK operon transcriptional repressor
VALCQTAPPQRHIAKGFELSIVSSKDRQKPDLGGELHPAIKVRWSASTRHAREDAHRWDRLQDSNPLDKRSEKIVEAAKPLFLATGYTATSMDDIATQASVSKTTLYKRYPSKAALFAAVISAQTERSGLEWDTAAFAGNSIDEMLIRIGTKFVNLICQPESLRLELVYHSEGASIPEVAAAFKASGPQQVVEIVTRIFRYAVSKGLLGPVDPHFAALQFLVILKGDPFGLAQHQKIGNSRRDRDTYVRRAVQLYLDGARPRPRK